MQLQTINALRNELKLYSIAEVERHLCGKDCNLLRIAIARGFLPRPTRKIEGSTKAFYSPEDVKELRKAFNRWRKCVQETAAIHGR